MVEDLQVDILSQSHSARMKMGLTSLKDTEVRISVDATGPGATRNSFTKCASCDMDLGSDQPHGRCPSGGAVFTGSPDQMHSEFTMHGVIGEWLRPVPIHQLCFDCASKGLPLWSGACGRHNPRVLGYAQPVLLAH